MERFAVGFDPELAIVDTVGAQHINLGYICKMYLPVASSGPQALPLLTLLQALNKVPGGVKLLLDAQQEWVNNSVGKVKAFIIVYSMSVGIERGVFRIEVGHVCKRTTHLKVSHNFNTQCLRANLGARLSRIGYSASLCQRSAAICGHHQQS